MLECLNDESRDEVTGNPNTKYDNAKPNYKRGERLLLFFKSGFHLFPE